MMYEESIESERERVMKASSAQREKTRASILLLLLLEPGNRASRDGDWGSNLPALHAHTHNEQIR